jgi:hypothetical protein
MFTGTVQWPYPCIALTTERPMSLQSICLGLAALLPSVVTGTLRCRSRRCAANDPRTTIWVTVCSERATDAILEVRYNDIAFLMLDCSCWVYGRECELGCLTHLPVRMKSLIPRGTVDGDVFPIGLP